MARDRCEGPVARVNENNPPGGPGTLEECTPPKHMFKFFKAILAAYWSLYLPSFWHPVCSGKSKILGSA